MDDILRIGEIKIGDCYDIYTIDTNSRTQLLKPYESNAIVDKRKIEKLGELAANAENGNNGPFNFFFKPSSSTSSCTISGGSRRRRRLSKKRKSNKKRSIRRKRR